MATITNYGRAPGAKEKPFAPDPACQPCPDCGGLECLCRPRFFAGQLLSEQDLNRLDHYITEKHKLHNRHLHGSGVVCGLEVRCAPCDSGLVTVSAGYALSPCGEDIVVCKQDTIDICALIARCRTDSEPDCKPYAGQESCGDVIEEWILSVRYAESPSRGITPLTGAGQGCGCSCTGSCSGKCGSGSSCGCGGGASCSCGAAKGQADPAPLSQPRLNRGAPPSCEPTLTCETYRYDVFRAPPKKVDDPIGNDDVKDELGGIAGIFGQLEGDMMARIACCLKQIQEVIPSPPGDIEQPMPDNMRNVWFQWSCQIRTALANYLVRSGGHDCEAIARLQSIVIPNPSQPVQAFQPAMEEAVGQLALLAFEAMIACICSNALPPCPPAGDPRVPLALIKVRRGDCHVVSVCNWTLLRRHVLTFPTLRYWFGFIPLGRIMREVMHSVCCDMFGLQFAFEDKPVPGAEEQPSDGIVVTGELASAGAKFKQSKQAIAIDPLVSAKVQTGLFEAVAMRQEMGGATATMGDLARATLRRQSVSIGRLDGEDRDAAIQRIAGTGPIGLLAGMFASAAPGLDFARSLGGVDRQSADIAELKAMVAGQAEEIRALRESVGGSYDGGGGATKRAKPRK
jgi:hypothetical protein